MVGKSNFLNEDRRQKAENRWFVQNFKILPSVFRFPSSDPEQDKSRPVGVEGPTYDTFFPIVNKLFHFAMVLTNVNFIFV